MITPWEVYWITRMDSLNGLLEFLDFMLICAVIGIVAARIVAHSDKNERGVLMTWRAGYRKTFWKLLIPLLTILLALMILYALLPTTKDACAIYLVSKIANNEQVQKVPNNFAKLLNTTLDEWINDSIIGRQKGEYENTKASKDRGALD